MRIFFVIACLLVAAPVAAENFYGAVAYSFGDDVWGRSWNEKTEPAAKKRALKECKTQGGKRCRIGVSVYNSCGAFAIATGATKMSNAGSSWGLKTHDDAKARALKECKKRSKGQACKVVASTCNFGK